jgi:hypothetical protein
MAAALIVVTATPTVAAQKQLCVKRPKIVRHLAKKFSETPVAIGLSRSGGVVELLSSDKGGSWTIILTTPDGNSCLVAAGENWESVVAKLGSDA